MNWKELLEKLNAKRAELAEIFAKAAVKIDGQDRYNLTPAQLDDVKARDRRHGLITLRQRGAERRLCCQQITRHARPLPAMSGEEPDKPGSLRSAARPGLLQDAQLPQGGLEGLNSGNPRAIKAYQYDIVCNGVELSSGAIRNHRPDIMLRAFELAGYGPEEVEKRFGGMLAAFRYGAPPHGGLAPGIDRIVMLLAQEPNIRWVIACPMTQNGEDQVMHAPCPVTEKLVTSVW